jgi:hypothetical protein
MSLSLTADTAAECPRTDCCISGSYKKKFFAASSQSIILNGTAFEYSSDVSESLQFFILLAC